MTTNIANQSPFLRTSRNFPDEIKNLVVQVNKAYVDTANCVNDRTIGLYPVNRQAITGNAWFFSNNLRQQTLRQVYTFTATGNIAHGIPNLQPGQIANAFGTYTDGTNSYGVFFATSTTIAGQLTFYVTSTNIVVQAGAGAPAVSSGQIVLEWLSQS